MNKVALGKGMVLLQFAGIGLNAYAVIQSMPLASLNPFFAGITLAGVVLGLVTLRHNYLGNFNIAPEIRNSAQLITAGPYRFIRHPMYLSVILFMLGLGLIANSILGWVGFGLASLAMICKSYIEESYLTQRFPEYSDYMTRTRRILPFIY